MIENWFRLFRSIWFVFIVFRVDFVPVNKSSSTELLKQRSQFRFICLYPIKIKIVSPLLNLLVKPIFEFFEEIESEITIIKENILLCNNKRGLTLRKLTLWLNSIHNIAMVYFSLVSNFACDRCLLYGITKSIGGMIKHLHSRRKRWLTCDEARSVIIVAD